MTLSRPVAAFVATIATLHVTATNAEDAFDVTSKSAQDAVAALCSDPTKLQDEDAPLNLENPSWAERLQADVLSIGCFLVWKDEGANVDSHLKEKVKSLQTTLLNYAMAHDFEISDGSLDGVLGPLTTSDFLEIARYVDFKDAFIDYSYDPLSHTAEFLKRFASEMKRFDKEGVEAITEEMEGRVQDEFDYEPIQICTGEASVPSYQGICGTNIAITAPDKRYG